MAWQATYRYARISPRKVGLMVDLIRGRGVQEALNVLKFSPNRAATLLSKVLTSAVANADEKSHGEARLEQLVVKEAFVAQGPTIKRWRPKDRGRAHPINKRTSHITVVVEQE